MKTILENKKKSFEHYDLSSMLVFLDAPIGIKNDKSSSYPYLGKKVQGSDIGHIMGLADKKYIIKAGVSLRLLTRAYIRYLDGKAESEKYINFFLGNFFRPITLDEDQEKEQQSKLDKLYRKKLEAAFRSYAETH